MADQQSTESKTEEIEKDEASETTEAVNEEQHESEASGTEESETVDADEAAEAVKREKEAEEEDAEMAAASADEKEEATAEMESVAEGDGSEEEDDVAEAPAADAEVEADEAEETETTAATTSTPAGSDADTEDSSGEGASSDEEEEGDVRRLLEEKVENAVKKGGDDLDIDIQAREERPRRQEPEGDGVPLTALEETTDLDPTGTKLGFTGEMQGRSVTLDDLTEHEAELAQDPDFEDLLSLYEETLTEVEEDSIVTGRVVSITDREVVVDIGFKSDGIVPRGEFDEDVSVGDEVEVYVERVEDRRGQLDVSKQRADEVRLWQRIERAYENDEVVEGIVDRRIKGGMIVDLYGVEAFLPGSQIDVRRVRDYEEYIDKKMEFKVVKLNPANSNIVVSHKALIEKELEAQRKKILENIEVGQVLEGTVKNIVDFGAFIDLGGVDGLLHITDLSWGRVSHPSEIVSLGEEINVVVLDYDEERQRISLGLKQLQPHPWENIDEKYVEGAVVEGKVVSITDYGAFVELEKGIEGLVHISEMSWVEHIEHPSQKVSLGQIVEVKILNIDREEKKISLGMKQLEPNPWEGLSDRYPEGTVLTGTVRNITNFGVFVEIEPGIDGLVHISDLSWTKKIRHPSEVVDPGEDMEVVVLEIDEDRQRVSLGHKQVKDNPWDQFEEAYAEGANTEGTIKRFVNSGLIVELPLEVEAFVPNSQLLHSEDDASRAYEEGQELELRVIDFDKSNRKIVLSEKALKHAEERASRQKEKMRKRQEEQEKQRQVQQFKKKSSARGATTLGELSGIEDLRSAMEEGEADVEAVEAVAEEEGLEEEKVEELKEEVRETQDEGEVEEDEQLDEGEVEEPDEEETESVSEEEEDQPEAEEAEEAEEEEAEEEGVVLASSEQLAREARDHISDTSAEELLEQNFLSDDEDRVTVIRKWNAKMRGAGFDDEVVDEE